MIYVNVQDAQDNYRAECRAINALFRELKAEGFPDSRMKELATARHKEEEARQEVERHAYCAAEDICEYFRMEG